MILLFRGTWAAIADAEIENLVHEALDRLAEEFGFTPA